MRRSSRPGGSFLIGGQAIAIWGAQLADYLPADDEPVTSRDVDFQGLRNDVEAAAELLGGRVFIPPLDDATPQTGKVVFADSDKIERTLDFLAQPLGLDAEDVTESAIEISVALDGRTIPLWVMNPERCLRSRVANSALPEKQTTLARRQLEAAIACTRAYGLFLLDQALLRVWCTASTSMSSNLRATTAERCGSTSSRASTRSKPSWWTIA